MKKLRICNSQINCHVGDLHGNAGKIINDIKRARENEADIVAFPELCVCGYPPEDLLLKPSFISENLKTLDEIAKNTAGITAIVGFVAKNDGIYNAAAVICDREIKGIYKKKYLPNYGVFDESRYFDKGDTTDLVFELKGIKFAVNICEDIWYTQGPLSEQTLDAGAELIINISASPFYAGKIKIRESMLKARANDNIVIVSYTNMVGAQDELVFDGGSMVVDSDGEVITSAARFSEDMIFADLDIENVVKKRMYSPQRKFEKDTPRPPGAGINNVKLADFTKTGYSKRIDMAVAEPMSEVKEIFNALVLGIRDYVTKNGFTRVVVGLSGGIDSALTATLAVLALGADSVAGVSMPSAFSSSDTKNDAKKLSENLGIEFITMPINGIYEKYLEDLAPIFDDMPAGITEENIQARIRGNLLMALSNKFGWLVLSTGNKSEISVGYCTLYGDMVGGFCVLKDVYKTIVYKLCEFINESEGRELIPKSTVEREPSAELSPGQKDSDTLPPYEVLDGILNHYIESDMSVEEITESGFDGELVKYVVKMVDTNEYKRRQAPPGVKITKKAFGKDRRMPITRSLRITSFKQEKS